MIITSISEYLFITSFSLFLLSILQTNQLESQSTNFDGPIIEILKYFNLSTNINNIVIFLLFFTVLSNILKLVNFAFIQFLTANIGTDFSTRSF